VWQAWWSLDFAGEPGGRRFLELVENGLRVQAGGREDAEAKQAKLPFQAAAPGYFLGHWCGSNPQAGLEDLSAWSAAGQVREGLT
jgi:hypothetical protein